MLSDKDKILAELTMATSMQRREEQPSAGSMALSNEAKVISDITRATGVKYSEEQLQVLTHSGGMCILACAGSGKSLANGTGVLTPNGYVHIEKLSIGDKCYSPDGKEQTITGVFTQGSKEVYQVVFSDNTVIPCCKDHLWTYQTYNLRRTTKKWETNTLEHIMNNVPISVYTYTNKHGEAQNRANIYIPMTKAVQFESKELPIKPYLLGVLLGSGNLKSSDETCQYSISTIDTDVIKRVNTELSELGAYLGDKDDKENYMVSVGIGYGHNNTEGLFTQKLKELGLNDIESNTKFIPNIYKYSSIKDRLDLLQGLIDTDGSCSESSCIVNLVSEQLIDNIKFIAETLGMTAVKYEKEVLNTSGYRLYIKTSNEIPKIHWSGHRENHWKRGQSSARRTITSIVKTGENTEMTCIKVSSQSGLFLTENCVVTHNTTILTHLLAKRVITGEIPDTSKLLCATYSKAGANEMDERLKKLFDRLGMKSNMTVKTLHAFYKMVLNHFGFPTEIITGKQRKKFLTESCKDAKVSLGDEDLQLIDSLLSYQVNNLMSDEAIVKSYVYTLDNVTQQQYTNVRMGYSSRKQTAGLIDFDDMQLYMYTCLVQGTRPDMIAYCRNKWTHFYFDEAQDISKIQFAIARVLITNHNNIMFIGDDDQCIFEWRGADPSIILDICGHYDIKKAVLSTNYRCCGNIVRPAAVGIVNNKRRAEKTMKPFNEGGSLRVCDTHGGSLYNQAKYAYEHIRKMVVDEGIAPETIAVLSRNNQHLAILNSMLFKDGVYCDTSAEMRLTQTNMYKDIRNVIELSSDGRNHNITALNLWRVCLYLGVRGAKVISDIQNSSNAKLSDVLGYMLNNHTRRNVDWNGTFKLPATVNARLENFCQGLQADTLDYLVYVYKLLGITEEKKRVAGFLGLYLSATEFMYKSQDRSRSIHGMIDYTLDLINKLGLDKLKAFFRASEQFESGKMVIPGQKVCMCTMHGSKGREWEHVVLFADDNVTFPSFEGIVTMNKNGVHMDDISASLDENRRLHYVAMTRAKSDLTIFTDRANVSVYTLEALGVFTPPQGTSNAHIISMATSGALYDDLVNAAQYMIFNKKSPYYYEVDISNINNAEETFNYSQEMSSSSNTGISLDSIQTGESQFAGKDGYSNGMNTTSDKGISLDSIGTGERQYAGKDS